MERHLMPASAETEPIAVKYGTNDCNAVVYGNFYVWAKPFTLNLYVGDSNIKSVAASIQSRITHISGSLPSASSASSIALDTKWHDTISIDCTPKDPVYNYQTTVSITAATRVVGPYPETQSQITRVTTVSSQFIRDGTDVVTKSQTSSTTYNHFYYDLNGGDLRNGMPYNEDGNARTSTETVEERTPYEDWLYTLQDQEKHQYRNKYENQKQETETTSERTVTTSYYFTKWTFHGTSSRASGEQNTIISNLASNINYDAVGRTETVTPKWTPIAVVTHDWTTTSTYYNPNWTWTDWNNVGSSYEDLRHEITGPTTTVTITDPGSWQPKNITSATPIRYGYDFAYYKDDVSSQIYSPGAEYRYTMPYDNDEVEFDACWQENGSLRPNCYFTFSEDTMDNTLYSAILHAETKSLPYNAALISVQFYNSSQTFLWSLTPTSGTTSLPNNSTKNFWDWNQDYSNMFGATYAIVTIYNGSSNSTLYVTVNYE